MPHPVIQDDSELTADMPGIRILSKTLQNVDIDCANMAEFRAAAAEAMASTAHHVDLVAALQSEIATLETALAKEQQRHTQLLLRHQSLLQAFTELHSQLQHATDECERLQKSAVQQLQQRRQRDLFILKQTKEIQRLRQMIS